LVEAPGIEPEMLS